MVDRTMIQAYTVYMWKEEVVLIDYDSPIPFYYQIREEIYSDIQQGKWAVGDMIPSEHQLSGKYNVSRNTVQRAIEDLVHKGVLYRKQGVGTFVSSPKYEQELKGFYSFSKAMQTQGIPTYAKVISMTRETATASQAKYLEIDLGDELFVLKRVRYANNVPIMIDTSRIPVSIAPDIDKIDFAKNSLYSILTQRYNIHVLRAKEIFEPVIIRNQESVFLEVEPNSPAIMLDRIAYSTTDKPVEYCRSIVPGDKCRYYTELR